MRFFSSVSVVVLGGVYGGAGVNGGGDGGLVGAITTVMV